MKKNYGKKQGVSLIVIIFSTLAILGFAGLVVDLGIIVTSQNELQKIAESCSLIGSSTITATVDSGGTVGYSANSTMINSEIQNAFNREVSGNSFLSSAVLQPVQIKQNSGAVRVTVTANESAYFTRLLGLSSFRMVAQGAAQNSPIYLNQNFPRMAPPNPSGSVISTAADTNIVSPMGPNGNHMNSITNIYGAPNSMPVCLGPAGYVTIRVPAPLEDKTGEDIFVRTFGNYKGYFLFAGVDTDPASPYINSTSPGSGIMWVNISCTGVSAETNNTSGNLAPYATGVVFNNGSNQLVVKPKFYGSGYFDMGRSCTDGLGNSINFIMRQPLSPPSILKLLMMVLKTVFLQVILPSHYFCREIILQLPPAYALILLA